MQKSTNQMMLISVLVTSSVAATFVNKYVLSVLKFTYPTVYQSWQTGFTSTVLILSSTFGLLQFSSLERSSAKQWCPAMCLFTLGIYSGSKALSKLPIPIFFTMFNIVHLVTASVDGIFYKKSYSSLALSGLSMGLIGLVFTAMNDDQVTDGWLFTALARCYCLMQSSRARTGWCFSRRPQLAPMYTVFAKRNNTLPLREIDKVMLNSLFSVVTLMLIGTITGEVGRSIEFQSLFNKRFHSGCLASGLTGALLGLSYSKLTEVISVAKIRWISALTMVLTSFLSLFFFKFTVSANLMLSIAVGLLGSVIFTYSVFAEMETKPEAKSEENKQNERV